MNIARQLTLPGSIALALVSVALAGCLPDDGHEHHHGGSPGNFSRDCRASSECGQGQYCSTYGLCVTIESDAGGRDSVARDAGAGDSRSATGGSIGIGSGGSGGSGGRSTGSGGARVIGGTGGGTVVISGTGGAAGGSTISGVGGCRSNADCPTTDCCVSGACQPNAATPGGPMAPTVCQFNSNCAAGARCRNGACERPCTTNASCGTGDVCSAGFCQTDPVGGTQCVLNSQCATTPPTPASGTALCINGHCNPACAADSDCGPFDRCLAGVCRPDTRPQASCRVNTDCATGQSCVGGTCRFTCVISSDCCACGPATQCRSGFCVTLGEAAPMCALAVDCGSEASCVDALCQ
jgi:hypothetical protein